MGKSVTELLLERKVHINTIIGYVLKRLDYYSYYRGAVGALLVYGNGTYSMENRYMLLNLINRYHASKFLSKRRSLVKGAS